jgi:uncharacterized membrane protein YhiD involved in acid resistance
MQQQLAWRLRVLHNMINLIPPEGYKAARHEYLFRVNAAVGLLIAGVALVLSAALIPAYVLVGVQTKEIERELAQNQSTEDILKTADTTTKRSNEVLAQLKKSSSTVSISELVEEVQRLAPSSISFKNFTLDSSKGATLKMQVQGEAPTREVLAKFKGALESSEKFLKAEIPIADLARNVDVPFVITITISKPK